MQLQSPDSAQHLNEGGEMVLRCKVDGSSEVRFEWFHNGLRMFRNERVSFRNKRLQVAALTAADNGIYSCRAVSEVGVVDSTDNFALVLPSECPCTTLVPFVSWLFLGPGCCPPIE